MNYSNSQRAGVILYLTALIFGAYDRPEDRQGNLRYINWWTGSPRTWTSEDRAELREASERGYLFSRKFDERADSDIIDYVCEMVQNEEFQQLKETF